MIQQAGKDISPKMCRQPYLGYPGCGHAYKCAKPLDRQLCVPPYRKPHEPPCNSPTWVLTKPRTDYDPPSDYCPTCRKVLGQLRDEWSKKRRYWETGHLLPPPMIKNMDRDYVHSQTAIRDAGVRQGPKHTAQLRYRDDHDAHVTHGGRLVNVLRTLDEEWASRMCFFLDVSSLSREVVGKYDVMRMREWRSLRYGLAGELDHFHRYQRSLVDEMYDAYDNDMRAKGFI